MYRSPLSALEFLGTRRAVMLLRATADDPVVPALGGRAASVREPNAGRSAILIAGEDGARDGRGLDWQVERCLQRWVASDPAQGPDHRSRLAAVSGAERYVIACRRCRGSLTTGGDRYARQDRLGEGSRGSRHNGVRTCLGSARPQGVPKFVQKPPAPYSDEGRSGAKGDGKELVDRRVPFGNDVLLFSDKHCAFQTDVDIKVAWPRWYKRAVEKSARQLAGAESFLLCRFPGRVFVDQSCQTKLPVSLPDPKRGPLLLDCRHSWRPWGSGSAFRRWKQRQLDARTA